RPRARAAAEGLLAAALPPLLGRRVRQDTLVLAYHNVVPRGEAPSGERSLHLPRAAFAAQLDALARTHDVVPLAEVLAPASPGARRPRAAITFDDAYRGAVTAGLEELAARGLPATFFVVAGRVGGGPFWWDALADGAGALPPAFRARALDEARGEEGAVLALARELGLADGDVPAHALPAGEAELRAAASVPGISFGAHGWSHASLARLEGEGLERELAAPLAWLRARFPFATVPWLSYPYGLSSPEAARAAAAAGYQGAVRVDGGWVRGGEIDRYAVPRLNVPAGLSRAGFRLRAAGVLGR
ncbi:MAG TPA: polysaccharide deacetylase family protein, partial [Longimicrobium sp.]